MKVVNVYDATDHGFCDFVRGTGALMNLLHGTCEVTWDIQTPLRELLEFPGESFAMTTLPCIRDTGTTDELSSALEEQFANSASIIAVHTNRYEGVAQIPDKLKDLFILKQPYRDEFECFFKERIGNQPYRVVHCRFGDSWLNHGINDRHDYPKWMEKLDQYENGKTVLLTDDGDFARMVRQKCSDIIVPNVNPVHTNASRDPGELLRTFYDLLILTRAREIINIHQFTEKTSSGFSRVTAKLFGIPFQVIRI